eukprot:1156975-Pelagomonas_calceolata.AAC.3
MDGLVELCAQFIASHLPHFASTADLVALPGELFSRFAKVRMKGVDYCDEYGGYDEEMTLMRMVMRMNNDDDDDDDDDD